MRIPPFPTLAPDLPDSLMQKENQPVLTMGSQKPVEPQTEEEEPLPDAATDDQPTDNDQPAAAPPPPADAGADAEGQ